MLANSSLFFSVVLQFLILCVAHELFILLILSNQSQKNIYHLLFVYIMKSLYFSRWNSKWYQKFIFCLSIFNLKQDNFQGFQKNSYLGLPFLLRMGQNLLLEWLLFCFIQHARLYFVCIYWHISLTNLRQLAFFINISNSYQILRLILLDKQFSILLVF